MYLGIFLEAFFQSFKLFGQSIKDSAKRNQDSIEKSWISVLRTYNIFIALQENVTYVLPMSEELTEFLELLHDESYTKATKRRRRHGRVPHMLAG